MSFCPICGAHHDPKMPCADRAGELLRNMGVESEPVKEEEHNKAVKRVNRSLLVLLVIVLAFFLLILLLPHFGFFRVGMQAARDDVVSGNAWLERKDYERAISDYTEAISSGRLSKISLAIAYYGRGIAWYEKEDYDKAIEDISQAIRRDPLSMYFSARGFIWYLRGEDEEALADLEEAVRVNPQNAKAYMTRGIMLFTKGEFSEAAAELSQSQRIDADLYIAIWLYLARTHSGDKVESEQMLRSGMSDKKKWPAPVAALYLGEETTDNIISRAADPDPEKNREQLCEANFFVGEWYVLRKETERARRLFVKAKEDCPNAAFEYMAAISELQRLK